MKINLKIDDSLNEDIVDFRVKKLNIKVQKAIDYLNNEEPNIILGYKKEEIVLLMPDEIVVISTEGKKIYARLLNGERYVIKERLYEMEQSLESAGFIRIANSTLANAKMIRKLMMKPDGSLCVVFKDESSEFASRRSVKNIKTYLGIGGKK